MTWTRKAKMDFYWSRRRAAVKQYKQFAQTLGTSEKRAKAKALKDLKREYAARKKGYNEINKRDAKIQKLSNKANLSKSEQRQLEKMLGQQSKQIVKVNERWQGFENEIGFEPVGADSERSQRNT